MIRQFIQAIYNCFYPKQPQTVIPDITFRKSSKQNQLIYNYSLFEMILERKLQELNDKI